MELDYNKALEEIAAWKGAEKEYWVAVDILKRYRQVSELELQKLNNGCDCWNEDFLVSKLLKLKNLAIAETLTPESVVEIIAPVKKRNGRQK